MIKSPNWCSNEVIVQGNEEDIGKLREFVKAGDCDFSFDAVIPMPLELAGKISPNRDEEDAKEMTEKYGAPDWYRWAIANWGTKWDNEGGNDVRIAVGMNVIFYYFDTAWSPPVGVMQNLAKKFPALHITLDYDEPGMDFWGRIVWYGGDIITEEDGPSRINIEMMADEFIDIFEEDEDVPDEDF